ncbi:MAG: hypothetical protein HYU32_04500 [candidate division NC10 bacterium]|nr:hypothetical protein [candidate division NC10 bacterium]
MSPKWAGNPSTVAEKALDLTAVFSPPFFPRHSPSTITRWGRSSPRRAKKSACRSARAVITAADSSLT